VVRDALSMAGKGPRRRPRRYGIWSGALLGGLVGAVLGTIFGLALLTLPGVVLGALIGAMIGPAAKLQDVADPAPSPIHPERHDVVVHRDHAAEARRVLGESGFRVK
jgi:hypothetical protein